MFHGSLGTASPGPARLANSVLSGHIAVIGLIVFKTRRIGKWWAQTTIEECSRMIPLIPLPSRKLRNSAKEGSQIRLEPKQNEWNPGIE